MCVRSYGLRGKLRRVVVDVCDGDNSSSCVRKSVRGVCFHVSGLNNQCVLRHFLQRETTTSMLTFNSYIQLIVESQMFPAKVKIMKTYTFQKMEALIDSY